MKLSLYNLRKGFRYLKNYGLKEFFIRLKEKGEPEQISYAEYAAGHKVTEAQLKIQTKESDKWSYRPLISCVYMGENREDALAMLEQQSYTNWNLICIDKLCTGKDNVLHTGASQLLNTLFTKHPADCICNIALSTSVWAYDTGNTIMKFKKQFVGKGLKSLDLNAF